MAIPTKPASKPDWTDGDAAKIIEPSSGKKLLGWIKKERPPFQWVNWLFFNIDAWIDYFEAVSNPFLQSTMTLANNQAAAADVPPVVLDSSSYRQAVVRLALKRKDASNEYHSVVELFCAFYGGVWNFERRGSFHDGLLGEAATIQVSFSFSGNQLQYQSSNMTGGSYVGQLTVLSMEVVDA